MKLFKRMLSLVLAAMLALGAVGGVQLPEAAAAETQSLAQLLTTGAIKPLGRTVATDGKLLTPWSGCGFEMNVFAPADTTLTVGYYTSYTCMWAVLVDGVQVWRDKPATGTGTFSVPVPYGTHTVSVVKETQISTSSTATNYLTTMSIGATLQAAPEDKELYIEFVGDSLSCGDGSMAAYQAGVKWTHPEDDSATHSFPWYTAKALNADYSFVSRGGIGLFDGTSAQEGTENVDTITDIYGYTAGYNTTYGEYDFTRQPDIVVVQMGGNDGIDNSVEAKTIETWKLKLGLLLELIREKNPDAVIVCMNYDATVGKDKYHAMKELTDSGDYGEAYTCFYGNPGNGSAALNYQKEGHPSAEDQQQIAKTLTNFLRYNDIVPQQEVSKTYNNINYYVAEGGDNSNDGLSLDKAKASVINVFDTLASRTFTEADRVVIYVSGTVLGSGGQNIDNYKKLRANGKSVPVLITTLDYDAAQDNKAELKFTYNATIPANDNALRLVCANDITYQNVRIKSYFNGTEGYATIYRLHSAGQNVILDNVEFATTGSNAWQVATDHFVTSGNNFFNATAENPIYSSVTFKNGDYTNLDVVSPILKNNIYVSGKTAEERSKAPHVHCKIVVEDGAKMGTIYGRYDTLAVGSTTVEINGGEVEKYVGTVSGTSSAYKTFPVYATDYTSEMNLVINGGLIHEIRGTGDYVKFTGNINTVMTGGRIENKPTTTAKNIYFGGGNNAVVNGNVTNTISGGEVHTYSAAAIDTMIVFGGDNLTVNGTLHNRISGGTFAVFKGDVAATSPNMYFGSVTSPYTRLLKNEITGGAFFCYGGHYSMGGRALQSVYEKIENVIGTKDQPSKSPRFLSAPVYLGGNWGQIGATTYTKALPTTCSDTVVLSNTIYGGYFAARVSGGVAGGTTVSSNYYEFIKGSVENNIYGGTFIGDFYGSSYKGNTFGKVTNNIYGGKFTSFFAASYNGTIHDGVQTNVYALEDLQICENNKPETQTKSSFYFHAGNANGGTVKATTEGRAAVKMVFAPENPEDITFYRTINMGAAITGTKELQIKGGYFPTNLKVGNTTVEAALADGSYCLIDGAVVTPASGATSVTGAVTVKPVAAMIGDTIYESLAEALQDAEGEEIVKLGMDAEVDTLSISTNKTLDLNGQQLTVDNMLCFGEITDSSDGDACVIMSNDPSKAVLHLQADNPQLPVYDSGAGGYRFFNYTPTSLGTQTVTAGTAEKFGFRLELTNAAGYDLLAEALTSGVSVELTLSVGDRLTIPYAYSAELVKTYAEAVAEQVAAGKEVTKAFVMTVNGLGTLGEDETLVVTPKIKTASGVVVELAPMTWSKAAE